MITTNDTSISGTFSKEHFEQLYISCRKKEQRIYSDDELKRLPLINSSHVHSHEWQIRKRSAARLTEYLENVNRPLNILEAGCGNGWLSAGLAKTKGSEVTGMDINTVELKQATKVFSSIKNLRFINDDFERMIATGKKFDVIIFAASIQYFSSLQDIINKSFQLLNEKGEIHILDSYFYSSTSIDMAKQRSHMYYRSIGCEELSRYYYHHSMESLQQFNYKLMYDPAAIRNKLLGRKDPFPWICIKQS